MLSRVQVATRAFVVVLLSLARLYELVLDVNRESAVEQVIKAYRKVLLKAHPDKGGRKQDAQTLQAAKETWDKARKGSTAQGGRPSERADAGALGCKHHRQEYRVHVGERTWHSTGGRGQSVGRPRALARGPEHRKQCVGTRRRNGTKP